MQEKSSSCILFSSCLLILFVSLWYESRAFMFSSMFGIVFLYFFSQKKSSCTLISKIGILIICGIILSILAMFFKTDSTLGRMFIYKISFNMFTDSWPTGIGFSRFSIDYLHYQAKYFEGGSFSNRELLLADNTYYAYNDYWQFVVELGILGLGIVILSGIAITKLVKICVKRYNNSLPFLLSFAIVHLIIICLAASFTYVFERTVFKCLTITFIVVIMSYAFLVNEKVRWKIMLILLVAVNSIIVISSDLYMFKSYASYLKNKEASKLSLAGYSQESLRLLKAIYPQMEGNEEYLYSYGLKLLTNDNFKEALPILLLAAEKKPSNRLYQRIGDCYFNLNQNEMAETAYKLAVFMVPNRFGTRFSLFKLYLKLEQGNKALRTANQILSLPVKVPSPLVNHIKLEVRQMLKEL